LDIEGTTTPIEFVHQTLFGYARVRVHEYLQRHWADPAVRADVEQLETEHRAETSQPSPPPWHHDPGAVAAYLHWLMDRDRKSTGLKSLQGKIWEEGYGSGELRGEVYPDVPTTLRRWRGQGLEIAIFSSGSVQAQRSLFRSTPAGDLTQYISAYFDTTTGPKTAPESYTRIAAKLGRPASDVVFISDVVAELDAARTSGMETALCVRNPSALPSTSGHRVIHSLDQLHLTLR
jgi:enolase-phosphatase E1